MTQEPLLGIRDASQMLGVSEAALRQWTDEGKIKAFITPGGHRRYFKAELKKFTNSNQRILGIKELAVELEETARLHREISQTSLKSVAWYERLSEENKERLTDLGRHLLNLIIKYITQTSRREEIIRLVRDVGHDHGEILAKLELPLTDSVGAFLLHRYPIMNVATHMIKRRGAFSGRVVEAIPLFNHVMDEALVALVAAHQKHYVGSHRKIEGGSTG